MPGQTVTRSSATKILPLIQSRLMTRLSWPAERVLILARDLPPIDAQADQYLFLRPRQSNVQPEYDSGAGRTDTRVSRFLDVTIRTRLALDETNSDLIWLTDASLGHIGVEDTVVDSLHDWAPVDTSGNWLVCQVMKFHGFVEERKDQDDIWGQSVARFDFTYEYALDQSFV